MKAQILKLVIPATSFLMACAMASGTNNDTSTMAPALIQGYIHFPSPSDCQPSILCSNNAGPICLTQITSGLQVFGRDNSMGCNLILYRP